MISFLFRFVFIYLTYARATAETFPWGQLTTTGTKPSKRYAHSSIVYNGKMVVFGGYDSGCYNDAWTLDLTTFAWTLLNTTGTKPSKRYAHSSVVSNGKMVVFGGKDSSCYNDAWTLDLTTFAWTLLNTTGTKPSKRYAHSSVVSNGKMVVFGGKDSSCYNDAWTLDLTTFAWTLLNTTGTKPSACEAHSSIVYNGKMVVFGGWDDSSRYNDAWTLDLTTFAWTLLTTTGTKPSKRYRHSSVVSNGKMVVFGGYDGSHVNDAPTLPSGFKNDAWTLDLTTFAWAVPLLTTTGTKPSARDYHSSVVSNGKMVVFGGSDGNFNDAWTLDLSVISNLQLSRMETELAAAKAKVTALNNTVAELKKTAQILVQQYASIHQECKANDTSSNGAGRRLGVVCGGIAKRVVAPEVTATTVAPTASSQTPKTTPMQELTATTTEMAHLDELDASTRATFSFVPAFLVCVVVIFL